jgi:transcriptional regulator with XRE-family HTH domain
VIRNEKIFFEGRVEVSFVQKEPFMGEMELIGARLNQARIAANLALQDIADRTKISQRFLTAIENDDFSALPGRVYIFGFTKAFARAVGFDDESIAAALREKMQLAGVNFTSGPIDIQLSADNRTSERGITEGNPRTDPVAGQGSVDAIYSRSLFGRNFRLTQSIAGERS